MLLVSSHTMPGYIHNNGTGGLKHCCWYPYTQCQRYIRNNGVGWSCDVVGILTHNATLHTQQRRRVVLSIVVGILTHSANATYTTTARVVLSYVVGILTHGANATYATTASGGLAMLLVSSHTVPTLHTQQRQGWS